MMKLFGPYKKRSKTASMQLSINAIVILVMAMSILGLGLGIIKGIKGQADGFLDFEVDISDVASSSEPITNFKNDVTVIINKEDNFAISFYNKGAVCEPAEVNVVCDEGLGTSTELTMAVRQKGTDIAAGEYGTIQFAAEAESDVDTPVNGFETGKSYFCDLEVICAETDPVEKYPFTLNT